MTKDERLRDFAQKLNADSNLSSEQVGAALTAFSRGYDEGFADGVVRGQNYQAQVTEMITGAMFQPRIER